MTTYVVADFDSEAGLQLVGEALKSAVSLVGSWNDLFGLILDLDC